MTGETGVRDLVTGLLTRDYFDEVIGRELERARRHGIALSVISVVFLNRSYLRETAGEEAADVAMAKAAQTLQSNLRESDAVFRWGDDEFLALLFEADAPSCSRKVRQLAAIFKPWRDGQGPTPHPVRIRIGAATHEREVVFATVVQSARAAARSQTMV